MSVFFNPHTKNSGFAGSVLSSIVAIFLFATPSQANPYFCTTPPPEGTPEPVMIEDTQLVTGTCVINGELVIKNDGHLFVDYSTIDPGDPDPTFFVLGDIQLTENGVLHVKGGKFIIKQDKPGERTIESRNNSTIFLENTILNTNPAGTGNFFMAYDAHDNSQMIVADSQLDTLHSWLLGNFYDFSKLTTNNSGAIPTEVYVRQGSTVSINGVETDMTVWIDFHSGAESVGQLNLPDQVEEDMNNNFVPIPYSWSIGKITGNMTGVDWQLDIVNAHVNLGIESRQGSKVVFNGKKPNRFDKGELTVAYFVDSGVVEDLSNLQVGVQNNGGIFDLGTAPSSSPTPPYRLRLTNINLGLIPWQIYAGGGGGVHITNSIINEVAAFNGGQITVEDSHLQLAVVGAVGVNSTSGVPSTVVITNTEIHSQLIWAKDGGNIVLNNSETHGSVLQATDQYATQSMIHVDFGEFKTNNPNQLPLPDDKCNFAMMNGSISDVINNDISHPTLPVGGIICNPFLKLGPVSRSPVDNPQITCNGTTFTGFPVPQPTCSTGSW